jgi:hypothetical protein
LVHFAIFFTVAIRQSVENFFFSIAPLFIAWLPIISDHSAAPSQRVAAVGAANAPAVLQLFARDAAASAATAAISAAASSFAAANAASASAAQRGPEQAQTAVHQGGFIVPGPAKIGAAAAAAMFDDNAANGEDEEDNDDDDNGDDDGDDADDGRMTDLAAPTLVLNRLAYASPSPAAASSVHASGGGSGKAAKRARHADS